jgi:hypothetical protein
VVAAIAAIAALPYFPGMVATPIHYEAWWKSQLPLLRLLGSNLGFWVGGDPLARKLPLLVAAIGLASAVKNNGRCAAFWLADFALRTALFMAYGLNLGYTTEPQQAWPWAERSAGHDMFRFDVLLLPPVVFFLGSGLATLASGVVALARRAIAADRSRARVAQVALIAGAIATILLWRTESATYHPLDFIASPYNRRFEIAEFRFLRDAFRDRARGARCYVLPASEGIALANVDVRPITALDADRERVAPTAGGVDYLYVNQRELRDPRDADALQAVSRRYALTAVARRNDGGDAFALFALAAAN